jgi:hypothetical protein
MHTISENKHTRQYSLNNLNEFFSQNCEKKMTSILFLTMCTQRHFWSKPRRIESHIPPSWPPDLAGFLFSLALYNHHFHPGLYKDKLITIVMSLSCRNKTTHNYNRCQFDNLLWFSENISSLLHISNSIFLSQEFFWFSKGPQVFDKLNQGGKKPNFLRRDDAFPTFS